MVDYSRPREIGQTAIALQQANLLGALIVLTVSKGGACNIVDQRGQPQVQIGCL